jgi:hypothetical protein
MNLKAESGMIGAYCFNGYPSFKAAFRRWVNNVRDEWLFST